MKCLFAQIQIKPLIEPDQEQLGQHFDAKDTVKNEDAKEKSDHQDKLEK